MVALSLAVLLTVVSLSYSDHPALDPEKEFDSPSAVNYSEEIDVPIAPETDVAKLSRDRRLARGKSS